MFYSVLEITDYLKIEKSMKTQTWHFILVVMSLLQTLSRNQKFKSIKPVRPDWSTRVDMIVIKAMLGINVMGGWENIFSVLKQFYILSRLKMNWIEIKFHVQVLGSNVDCNDFLK